MTEQSPATTGLTESSPAIHPDPQEMENLRQQREKFEHDVTTEFQRRVFEPQAAATTEDAPSLPRYGSSTHYRDAVSFDKEGNAFGADGTQIFAQTPEEKSLQAKHLSLHGVLNIPFVDQAGNRLFDGITHEQAHKRAIAELDAEEAYKRKVDDEVQQRINWHEQHKQEQGQFDNLPLEEQAKQRAEQHAWRAKWPELVAEATKLPDIEIYELGDEVGSREITPDEAVELLSYTDVLSGEAKQNAIRYTETSESGKRYSAALQDLVKELGSAKLKQLAETMRFQCLSNLINMGIAPSEYGRSLSWAYWDLAKQRYYTTHPSEAMDNYRVHDPIENSTEGVGIRRDIVRRHIGWEISQMVGGADLQEWDRQSEAANTLGLPYFDKVSDIIGFGERNETGQLRSHELAKLGRAAVESMTQTQSKR